MEGREAATVIDFLGKTYYGKDQFLTLEDKIELISKIEATTSDMIKWYVAFLLPYI